MTAQPPSTIRVLRLVGGVMVRRFANQISSRRKSSSRSQPRRRTGTARKGGKGVGAILRIALIGGMFLVGAVFLGSMLAGRLAELGRRAAAADDGRIWVTAWEHKELARSDRDIERVRSRVALGTQAPAELAAERAEELAELERDLVERAGGTLSTTGEWGLDPAESARVATILDGFESGGIAAFDHVRQNQHPLQQFDPKPTGVAESFLVRGYALILMLVIISQLLTGIGATSRDLSRNEWSFEWLFSFPVPALGLFISKWIGYTLVSAATLMTVFPLVLTLTLGLGFEWSSIGIAVLISVAVALMTAALRVALETWLRLRMSARWSNTVTAVTSLLGILMFYSVFWVAIAGEVPEWFYDLVLASPDWVAFTPFSSAALLASSEWSTFATLGVVLGGILVVCSLAIGWSAFAVRHGLERSAGPVGGTRTSIAHARGRWTDWLDKELVMLLRDRTLLVSTLVVPVVIVGFQILINPGWSVAAKQNFTIAGVTAFGIGSYVALFAAQAVVHGEDKSFWLLFTFPQPLSRTLRRKVRLWIGFVWFYAIGAILLLGRFDGSADQIGVVALVLAGSAVFVFLVVGLSILGADPFEEQKRRRVKPETAYLMMLLAAAFCWALRDQDWWTRGTILVLFSLTAISVWQIVEDRAPFLLDPVAMPKPRLSLVHGAVAVFLFFVLQSLLGVGLLTTGEFDPAQAAAVAFVVSGVLVTVGVTLTLSVRGVPFVRATGLSRDPTVRSVGLGASVFVVTLAGAVSGAAGLGYVMLCASNGWFAGQLEVPAGIEYTLLALFAAPLIEEFLFRGLVFRGMRRTWSLWPSALASAALFAMVHPAVSWLPVFGLGVATAFAFERTRVLLAPILVHVIYNAIVVLLR